jgi:hypothetical protein
MYQEGKQRSVGLADSRSAVKTWCGWSRKWLIAKRSWKKASEGRQGQGPFSAWHFSASPFMPSNYRKLMSGLPKLAELEDDEASACKLQHSFECVSIHWRTLDSCSVGAAEWRSFYYIPAIFFSFSRYRWLQYILVSILVIRFTASPGFTLCGFGCLFLCRPNALER